MKLENKVILVTGAGHGIGRAIAERLANAGAQLAITYRDDSKGAKELENVLVKAGKKAKSYRANDLTDDKGCEELFAQIKNDFGKIDIVVANAGGAGATKSENLEDLDIEAWQLALNANLLPTIVTTKHAIKALQANKSGGKILLIGSVLGHDYMGSPRITAYSAAKAGVHNFGRTLAKALAPKIIINVLAPGRAWSAAYEDQSENVVKARFAVNRHGRPVDWDEIAQAAQMILENDSMIGQLISVDAGFSIRDT